MNKAIVKGRLGFDPDVRATNTGKKVAKIRIAVDRRGKDAGVDWLDILLWEQKAEFAERYLAKGRSVLVEGRIQTRQYEKDGVKYNVWEIVAENIEFADSKPQVTAQSPAPAYQAAPAPAAPARQAAPAQAPAPAAPYPGNAVTDDDIPF